MGWSYLALQCRLTVIAVKVNWGFSCIKGIGLGWAGVIWLYSVVFFFPLDLFKVGIRYILSGKVWDNVLENNTAFTIKKDYVREGRDAQWDIAERTLHGNILKTSVLSRPRGKQSLRELQTLKGRVELYLNLKGLDIDTIQQHYTL